METHRQSSDIPLILVVASLPVLVLILTTLCRKPKKKCLPSPPSDPIIGHARHIPLTYSWLLFSEWFKTYGEAISVTVLGNPMVVLNSVSAAHEILDRKGANFSTRPPMFLHREWLGWKDSLVFMTYGEKHKTQRRLVQRHFTPQSITTHHPMLRTLAERLVDKLMENPLSFVDHIHDYTSRSMVAFTYGYEPMSEKDPRMEMVESVSKMATAFDVTVLMLVDLVPFIRHIPTWVPGMNFKKRAMSAKAHRDEMAKMFFQFVVESKASGTCEPSLLSQAIDSVTEGRNVKDLDTKMRDTLMNIGAIMYVAGVDTSDAALETFFLAMAIHPNFARRAQMELDSVLGPPDLGIRIPMFKDRAKLPYVECILQEVFRWHPPVPLGVPHMSNKPDDYHGMAIPENCAIIPNIWHMCHDENVFPSPLDFNPDRFLVSTVDPKTIIFGFGRRRCPGVNLADTVIWLVIATVLANFDILPPVDPVTNEPLVPTKKFTSASTSRPETFSCRIVPRWLA